MERLPIPFAEPSPYERRAYGEILLWKSPRRMGWFGSAVDRLNQGLNSVTDLLRRLPGVDWTIENVVSGLLRLTNEITHDSVWTEAVYRDFARAGVPVSRRHEIARLDLARVDAAARGLDAKYRMLAAVEGAAAGYAGLPGIVPDVVALVALNLRAVAEYAAYYGFDTDSVDERLFALHLLDAVSAASDTSKQVAMTPVLRLSSRLVRENAIDQVERMALARAIRNAVEALGLHLTRAKLAQIVPATGAVVGSGFNAYYTSKVCDAAFFLYRERFLLRKYPEQFPGAAPSPEPAV